MAEAIGTTASVLGLASAVMAVTERVVNAIKNVRSAPQTIETVASILCNTDRTLQSIRQTPSLDDNNLIADQLRNIEGILVDIETLLKTLQQQQRNSKTHNILLALRDPTGKNNKLDELLGRLDTANLHLLIQMGISHVGTTEGVTTELATAHKALLEVKTTGEETNVLLKDSIALLSNQMGQSRVIPSTYRNGRVSLPHYVVDHEVGRNPLT
ncbi:hypothetical protein CCHR01_04749 [Colletotrichum chrysophilum]|uniref:Fungal N-terminal domain-containing protein n=1 Tax=Colletotrichum chrysophilum TaxID=1836956 RepID=A0AAD9ATT3_9PEZI|nr:hypothetical protein CCHR01_04749 [Colletotrichum chrysophilum]